MANKFDQQRYVRLKWALDKAVATKDYDKIITECNRAFQIFEDMGYPDDWTRWERAKDDAEMAKRYQRS